MAANARRRSTIATYDSRLRRFGGWCQTRQALPTDASLTTVADFLLTLFQEGKQVSTIRNYRSAIAAIHRGFPDGSTPGNNREIAQLLRGMANKRPRVRRLAPSWGLSATLHALTRAPYEPMARASLAVLTKKTLFLIALASARRRSCLHALSTKRNHIRFENQGVRMVPDPSFIAKNQVLNFLPGDIFYPGDQDRLLDSRGQTVVSCSSSQVVLTQDGSSQRYLDVPLHSPSSALLSGLERYLVPLASGDHPPFCHRARQTKGPRYQGCRCFDSPVRRNSSRGYTQGGGLEDSNHFRRLLLIGHSTGRVSIWSLGVARSGWS
ncbi:hypothetical protein BSL78_13642 [Apostichopus japonicus]|uniref:Integrase SAM-like N-terminal domain-containing protein n=1 Tax=Stichopus japonicus TaxID=307972 RepID=A0A2G8KNA8_STIJA|nr:hypothetical protein BSL78_13642 [Apostichopus japonicus]